MNLSDIKTLELGIVGTSFSAKTTTGTVTGFAIVPSALGHGPLLITHSVEYPGTPPTTFTADLEGCIDDPTVEANWYKIGTGITQASTVLAETVTSKGVRFVRQKVSAIATPNGGVSGKIALG